MSEIEPGQPKRHKRLTSCTDERNNVDYFELVNPLWFISSLFIFGYLGMLSYAPYLIPFEKLGHLGELSSYLSTEYPFLVVTMFWGLIAIHILEAIYVVSIAHQFYLNPNCLNKWFLQTFLVGMPSTKKMLSFQKIRNQDEEKKK